MANKVWFVTGASRGIGAEIVKAVLAHGDKVAATARDPKSLEQKFGSSPNLLNLKLDVTDENQAEEAVKATLAQFGKIDVLVNNAGYGILGAVEEASTEEVKKMYETNVFGLLNVTRAVLPSMRQNRSGIIYNISSVGGYKSGPGFGAYCSTKFALEGLSEALHGELAPLGVHVTIVEPGYFRTDFLESSSLVEVKKVIDDYKETAGAVRKRAKEMNQNQIGDPAKLAQVLIQVADSKNPPLRLPLGIDAMEAIEAKNHFVKQELEKWREVSSSTNFS